jgi:hypothetical protein
MFLLRRGDNSVGGLLVPECIIRPVVSDPALILFIRYNDVWKFQF